MLLIPTLTGFDRLHDVAGAGNLNAETQSAQRSRRALKNSQKKRSIGSVYMADSVARQRPMERDRLNRLSHAVIGAAIEVHRALGPGLLESAYQSCLRREFTLRGISFDCERPLPVEYKGIRVECGYRVDFLVGGSIVVEIKSIEALAPIHEAQLLTYLRIGGWPLGLLINFNVPLLKHGIWRRVMSSKDQTE